LFKLQEREFILYIDYKDLKNYLMFFKLNNLFQCKSLLDIICIDYPNRIDRFEINYHLLSYVYNFRINLKTIVNKNFGLISISDIYESANWLEREIWDMFGVFFFNHPDLRRILTDYGFEGFPLRKDFPLTGFLEVYYDEQKKKISLEPIELSQDYRFFDFLNPWEIK